MVMHIDQVAWSFQVPGQPPSVNHLYVRVRNNWNKVAKAKGVEQYQNDVVFLCRQARPSGWNPTGQIRIEFAFFLSRDADCDNLIKALQDAVAMALGINDKAFLPCVISKETGCPNPYTTIRLYQLP